MFDLLDSIFLSSSIQELTVVDVGAYKGEFTLEVLRHFPNSRLFLFEPSVISFDSLSELFFNHENIQIFNKALSDHCTLNTDFYLFEDGATNGLLPQLNQQIAIKASVETITLDNFFHKRKQLHNLHLLKIDTQGNDLKVLKGAHNTILSHKPCIIVEAIFIELYQNQDLYYEILSFMQTLDYHLVNIYNVHYTSDGRIAYGDFFFVHSSTLNKLFHTQDKSEFICYDVDYLVTQNKFLQKTCQERLELINQLHQLGQEHIRIIEQLKEDIKKSK